MSLSQKDRQNRIAALRSIVVSERNLFANTPRVKRRPQLLDLQFRQVPGNQNQHGFKVLAQIPDWRNDFPGIKGHLNDQTGRIFRTEAIII